MSRIPDRRRSPLPSKTLLGSAMLLLLALAALPVLASRLTGPGPVRVVVLGEPGSAPAADPWQPGWDGRPAGPVTLSAAVTVRPDDVGDDPVQVIGIGGPGIAADRTAPVTVRAGTTTVVPVRAEVDCTRLPAGAADDAFRLRLAATDRDGNPRTGSVPVGAPAREWAGALRTGCRTWTARHDLTITAIGAQVHPTLPHADLDVTFVNAGHGELVVGLLGRQAAPLTVTGPFPVRVPGPGTVTVRMGLDLDRCDVVGSLVYAAVGSPTLSDRIELVAGPPDGAPAGTAPAGTAPAGTAPAVTTGTVLSAAASSSLGSGLGRACGGIPPVTATLAPGGVRYDLATRQLVVTAVLVTPPGRVRTLSLQPDGAQPGDVFTAMPAWSSTPAMPPDAQGRVRVTVRYVVPGADPCPLLGATLLRTLATLRVPDGAAERVLRYSVFLDLAQDTAAVPLLCGKAPTATAPG